MSEFWLMDGYAAFVWGSYVVTAAVFAWNVVAPRVRRREILQKLRRDDAPAGDS